MDGYLWKVASAKHINLLYNYRGHREGLKILLFECQVFQYFAGFRYLKNIQIKIISFFFQSKPSFTIHESKISTYLYKYIGAMWVQDEWLKCPKSCGWWPLHYMISLSRQNSCVFILTPLWNIPFWIGTFPRLLWVSFLSKHHVEVHCRDIFFLCVCPMVTLIKSILLA